MGLQLDLGFMTSGLTKFLIELMPIKRRKEKVLFFRGNIACFCHLEIRLKCPFITLLCRMMLGLVKMGSLDNGHMRKLGQQEEWMGAQC